MKTYRWSLLLGCLLFLIFGNAVAGTAAPSPKAAIKGPIDQIIHVLKDPQFESIEKKADQRNKIWEIARPMFDTNTISEKVTGEFWTTFSIDEKKQFADVFARFLSTTYIQKMQAEFEQVAINYNREAIRGNKALVRTVVVRQDTNIAIDYKMKKSDGQWKIFDVLVVYDVPVNYNGRLKKGTSLVKNYWAQFNSILKKETPAQLIKRLEKKLADQENLSPDNQAPEPISAVDK